MRWPCAARARSPSIPPEHQADFNHGLKLFFEEGRALTGLDHPNVVRVLNFFRANETVYLVMRFETGQTLRDHIRQHRGRLSEAFMRKMFSGVLDGLGEVHGHGLLHLDIKPANIWLRDDGSPVLLDFGAARYAVDIGPPAPRAMYTPGYAAPEQYHGKFTLGPWTDIYAVGACMYAALAGSAPQAADERMVDDELLPARQRWGMEYSPRLLATIDECLRLEPATPSATCACAAGVAQHRYRRRQAAGILAVAHRPQGLVMNYSIIQESRIGGATSTRTVSLAGHRGYRVDGGRRRHGRPPARRGRRAARGRQHRFASASPRSPGPPGRPGAVPRDALRHAHESIVRHAAACRIPRPTPRRAPPASPAWSRMARQAGRMPAIRGFTWSTNRRRTTTNACCTPVTTAWCSAWSMTAP
jgi:hypothetical protein